MWKVLTSKNSAQHFFVVVAQRAQQHGHRQLAATVDAGEQRVLRVELEVQPRAAVRNDAGAVQQLARAVGLAAVVVEEHARRTVQLRDDDALGAVDDEGAVVGHERDLAHVDLLLLHVLDGLGRRLAVVDHQAHGHAQRGAVAEAAVAALALVERRLAELVADVFQRGVAAVAGRSGTPTSARRAGRGRRAWRARCFPAGTRGRNRPGSRAGTAPRGSTGACRSPCGCASFR